MGKENIVTAIREGLKKYPGCGGSNQIGLGGVFSVEQGKVKGHVMPDFKKTLMVEGPEVEEWLQFYEMGPDLTCLTSFLTEDPTGGDMNYRLEHTHFYRRDGKEGGHYHYDTTKEEIKYVGYFTPAGYAYRMNNAYKQ